MGDKSSNTLVVGVDMHTAWKSGTCSAGARCPRGPEGWLWVLVMATQGSGLSTLSSWPSFPARDPWVNLAVRVGSPALLGVHSVFWGSCQTRPTLVTSAEPAAPLTRCWNRAVEENASVEGGHTLRESILHAPALTPGARRGISHPEATVPSDGVMVPSPSISDLDPALLSSLRGFAS